jgi:single-strand DNA-binding protein
VVSYNKVILIGNLTKDPEIRYTPGGTPVASFRLAVNHRYKQGEDLKEDVCFIDIVVFGKQAENCGQYLSKGSSVIVDGRLQERRWETDDRQKRSKHEIVAQTVRFFPKRTDRTSSSRADAGPEAAAEEVPWEGESAASPGSEGARGGTDVPF